MKRTRRRKGTPNKLREDADPLICYNRDCRIRRSRPCKGWQGCPGFKSKPFTL